MSRAAPIIGQLRSLGLEMDAVLQDLDEIFSIVEETRGFKVRGSTIPGAPSGRARRVLASLDPSGTKISLTWHIGDGERAQVRVAVVPADIALELPEHAFRASVRRLYSDWCPECDEYFAAREVDCPICETRLSPQEHYRDLPLESIQYLLEGLLAKAPREADDHLLLLTPNQREGLPIEVLSRFLESPDGVVREAALLALSRDTHSR